MIDWNRVSELRSEVGEDEFSEVIELFLEEVDEVIDRLRETPDPQLYEQDLHFLKGSALNLGFQELGQLCQIGETAAAAGQQDEIALDPILESYVTSRTAFLEQVKARFAA